MAGEISKVGNRAPTTQAESFTYKPTKMDAEGNPASGAFRLGDMDPRLPDGTANPEGPLALVQQYLSALLPNSEALKIDGKLGPKTSALVKAFQETVMQMVPPSGAIDLKTVEAILAGVQSLIAGLQAAKAGQSNFDQQKPDASAAIGGAAPSSAPTQLAPAGAVAPPPAGSVRAGALQSTTKPGEVALKEAPPSRPTYAAYLKGEISALEKRIQAGETNLGPVLAALKADLNNLNRVESGNFTLPAATKKKIDALTQGLPPDEAKMVTAKALALAESGYSIEDTSPERFSANLAFEMSGYLGGLQPSGQLAEAFALLMHEGAAVFEKNPALLEGLTKNVSPGG